MYEMLEHNLPSGCMDKEEIDKKTVLTSNWKSIVKLSRSRNDEVSRTQLRFKSALIEDITVFSLDIQQVRSGFQMNGPLVQGILPMDAVDGLFRFKEELKVRERRYELYRSGEEIFAFEHKEYPEVERTENDIMIASQLFDLYVDVIRTINIEIDAMGI
eukprot:scaffold8198_cov287-Chaetoceros_neogracile.AAC.6